MIKKGKITKGKKFSEFIFDFLMVQFYFQIYFLPCTGQIILLLVFPCLLDFCMCQCLCATTVLLTDTGDADSDNDG